MKMKIKDLQNELESVKRTQIQTSNEQSQLEVDLQKKWKELVETGRYLEEEEEKLSSKTQEKVKELHHRSRNISGKSCECEKNYISLFDDKNGDFSLPVFLFCTEMRGKSLKFIKEMIKNKIKNFQDQTQE